ncbi:MAG: glycoside hydrolase family 27 protein [Treponema sp.]|nr:glycoside hydrolase family 27 protein [Treponema sp.]
MKRRKPHLGGISKIGFRAFGAYSVGCKIKEDFIVPLLAKTPPMGWNSWNTFGGNINEELVKNTADAFISHGLKDAGYEYIVIDDCWSKKSRDENGRLVPDKNKFPNGMKALADYIHSKGLKFGIYSCAGIHTCAGYPGSFEHEFVDAVTFAEWGVDYLKYDYCYKPRNVAGEDLYKRMAFALRNCGRNIVLSACNWGNDGVQKWIKESGCHLYRSTGDIQNNWKSIEGIMLSQLNNACFSGIDCWNDMDMLVVGMGSAGENAYVLSTGCSQTEYRTHFSVWAVMNSPLMIGCDVRNMTEQTVSILTNKDVIALNQDIEGRAPYCIRQWNNPDNVFSLVKPLSGDTPTGGGYAIAMINISDVKAEMSLQFYDIGLPYASGFGLEFYDCWKHEVIGFFTERASIDIEPHECRVFRCRVARQRPPAR